MPSRVRASDSGLISCKVAERKSSVRAFLATPVSAAKHFHRKYQAGLKSAAPSLARCFWPRFAHLHRSPHLVFTIRLALLIALYWQSFYFKLYRNENPPVFLLPSRCAAARALRDGNTSGWRRWSLYIHFKLRVTSALLFFSFQVSSHGPVWIRVFYIHAHICLPNRCNHREYARATPCV